MSEDGDFWPPAPGRLYRVVRVLDDAFHRCWPDRELPVLCNLERTLWWKGWRPL